MEQRGHVAISDLLRVHACPVRFYYERNDPIIESDRYLICKQVSYHLGRSLESDVIWNEVLSVRPGIDNDLRSFLDTCITSCKKTNWKTAAQSDVRVISEKHGIVGMVDRIADDGTFSIIRAASLAWWIVSRMMATSQSYELPGLCRLVRIHQIDCGLRVSRFVLKN